MGWTYSIRELAEAVGATMPSADARFSISRGDNVAAAVPGNAPRWIMAMTGLATEKIGLAFCMMLQCSAASHETKRGRACIWFGF